MGVWKGALEAMALSHRNPNAAFWRGKRVLVTGHTGFKGAWLTIWLHRLGAEVTGIALSPPRQPALYTLTNTDKLCASWLHDIRDAEKLAALVAAAPPQIVLHLAAQSLVREGYRDPLATFATNAGGTANLLEAIRPLPDVRVAVMVTTDKVYRNLEQQIPFCENDALGGHDPYSASKAAAEIIVASYRDSFFAQRDVAVATARAGNVIGGGDWSQERLLPDAVRAWQRAEPLKVRRPQATRPWQHVLEPLAGYLALAEDMWKRPALADSYNFGPATGEALAVRDVIEIARQAYGDGDIQYGDGSEGPHEARWLALDTTRARKLLSVTGRWTAKDAITRTMNWYRGHETGADPYALCLREIADYESAA